MLPADKGIAVSTGLVTVVGNVGAGACRSRRSDTVVPVVVDIGYCYSLAENASD